MGTVAGLGVLAWTRDLVHPALMRICLAAGLIAGLMVLVAWIRPARMPNNVTNPTSDAMLTTPPIRSLMAEAMNIKNPSRCSHVRFMVVQREWGAERAIGDGGSLWMIPQTNDRLPCPGVDRGWQGWLSDPNRALKCVF